MSKQPQPPTPQELWLSLASMGKTLATFVEVIKYHNARLDGLEAKLAEPPETNATASTQPQNVAERYLSSCQRNRRMIAAPVAIAYAAHLHFIKRVPAKRIIQHGVLSQFHMYTLRAWETQHLLDYCEVHGVSHVYHQGLPESEAKKYTKDWEGLCAYIANPTPRGRPLKNPEGKNKKPSRLARLARMERVLKEINEQKAQKINLHG